MSGRGSYADFLARKAQANDASGFEPSFMPDFLFDFQRELTEWAVEMGRAALYVDTGLGKTPMELVWARNVAAHTGKPVLIVTPLAVSHQIQSEAHKFGIDAEVSRDGTVSSTITITNYERLHLFDSSRFGGVVCDESSAIKAFDGKRRAIVTEFMRSMRYRLLATATAAPNDYIELGTSSEALGYLGHMDMLNRFFTNKLGNSSTGRYRGQGPGWRFKGHAEDAFWNWVASWARAMRKPSDLGFDDGDFALPALHEIEHVVSPRTPPADKLFDPGVNGLSEEREEQRRTLNERCEKASELLSGGEGPAVAWCHRNDESALLAKLIPDAVELEGSDSDERKEEKLIAFSAGDIETLVTKPSIAAFGLNWQHANRMTYFPSHSYEQMYQAIRRMWRFGQQEPVTVDMITTTGGLEVLRNLQRKARQADRMFDALTAHMREAQTIQRNDNHDKEMEVPTWAS